jgi:hypothetical protein
MEEVRSREQPKATPELCSSFCLHSSSRNLCLPSQPDVASEVRLSPRMSVQLSADTWSCMLEVKWEFQGSDQGRTVQTAVEKIVRRLQCGLRAIVCPIHRRSPLLRVGGSTLSSLDIGFETCCQTLMDETTARIQDIRKRGRTRALARPEMRRAAVADQIPPDRQAS